MGGLNVALGQVNATVGDLAGNARKVIAAVSSAGPAGPDVIIFPEMVISGYPPEDLLLRRDFLEDCRSVVEDIATKVWNAVVIVGFPDTHKGKVYNAAAVLHEGAVLAVYHKVELPNYGVFDEKRYFTPGKACCALEIKGSRALLTICEDIWVTKGRVGKYAARVRPDVILNISASPFHAGKYGLRCDVVSRLARETGAAVCYVNLVGGQDELVFDGGSLAVDRNGELLASAGRFKEDLVTVHVPGSGRAAGADWAPTATVRGRPSPARASGRAGIELTSEVQDVYEALVLGTRDYVIKNGFTEVLIGLSGGVDSSLVAAIAVEALGADNVVGVTMPSEYTSDGTLGDARLLAGNLGISLVTVPIGRIYDVYLAELSGGLDGRTEGVALENIQARIRGNILMAFSNHRGSLVLTTGNKSETAVGYCTLYGDLAGGFAAIKDVPKTLVYELVRYINEKDEREVIPATVISRAPSAELRPDQKDEDTLPPYDVLDSVLELYVEHDMGADEIAGRGAAIDVVRDTISRVDGNEYKRRQAPPGVKITPKAFGRDRRLPITNGYSRSRRVKLLA